jgi:hypothetical protein
MEIFSSCVLISPEVWMVSIPFIATLLSLKNSLDVVSRRVAFNLQSFCVSEGRVKTSAVIHFRRCRIQTIQTTLPNLRLRL